MVDQIELTPFCNPSSPLTRGQKLNDSTVLGRGANGGPDPCTSVAALGLQHGLVLPPKSTHGVRIAANAQIFAFGLDAQAMQQRDALEEDLLTGWDPASQH
jgi:diketogulonate reductase-like aldo/keto reductase